jgi:Holliday junction DNA helicase RuvA
MIGFLRGTPLSHDPPLLILDVHGVGYEVFCGDAPNPAWLAQDPMELFIYAHIKEDQFSLFGFPSLEDKKRFLLLLGISGVGPKTAFALTEHLSSAALATAVQANQTTAFQRVPGIGKKTAERLILELKGKLDVLVTPLVVTKQVTSSQQDQIWQDLRSGLTNLGFPEIKINRVLHQLRSEFPNETSLDHLMGTALRSMHQP